MKCVIEGNCVKAFGKAIHALSRIGDELWLDPMVKGLAVRSVNSAHSAYGCFLFSSLFFQYYSVGTEPTQDFGIIKCKLVMKRDVQHVQSLEMSYVTGTYSNTTPDYQAGRHQSVLPLFRSLGAIERNVERCEISINTADSRVVFQFHCRHGITKTYNLGFHESEALQAVFASHLCPNVLKAQARLLGNMVMHFPVSQEEITLSMTPLRVILRNYEEISSPCKGPMKMYTEMSLHPREFDYFQVGVDSDITFCLKELRGLLSFAESHGLPVSVHFGAAGRPVCFSVEDMVLEASVVLATLIDPDSRGPSQTTEAKAQAPITLRCGDAAGPLRGSHETEPEPSLQSIHPVTELVASSHGSPLSNPASLSRQYTTKERCKTPGSVPAPTSKICSLLFGALAEEQVADGGFSSQSVLACSSDIEDDVEDEG